MLHLNNDPALGDSTDHVSMHLYHTYSEWLAVTHDLEVLSWLFFSCQGRPVKKPISSADTCRLYDQVDYQPYFV